MKEFKYLRPGHVNLDRICDQLVIRATEKLPGTGELPAYWSWESQESFLEKHADLGPIVWAKTASYHLLLIKGKHIFRIWTDSSNTIVCDVCDELAKALKDTFEVEESPASIQRKIKPMTKRIRMKTIRHVDILILQTLLTFGVV